jgi:hypothetical protein
MKRVLLTSLLSLVAFAATAQAPVPPAVDPADVQVADQVNDDAAKPYCLQDTGSLITVRQNRQLAKPDKKCAPATGRSYSRRDLDRTGSINAADALRRLDPSISIH